MGGSGNCRVCGGRVAPLRAAGSFFDRCGHCGYAFLHGRSEPSDYWRDEGSTGSGFWTDAKDAYFGSALELLDRRSPGRRLVDVGGGVGFFAELALRRGWDAFSLDVSSVATMAARERIGRERALESLDSVPARTFDVATLWCVIAHVDDPADLMRDVARVLRPGGLVWVTTPNFLFHRWYGEVRRAAGRPIDFSGDDHRGQFTPASVSILLARAGFEPASWHYRGVTELCGATMRRGVGVALKRGWNRAAYALAHLGGPNAMSELQATARRVDA